MLRFSSEAEYYYFRAGRRVRLQPKQGKWTRNTTKKDVSPHAVALAKLAKNPDLESGHQEHYIQVRVFDFFERYHPEIYECLAAYPAGGTRTAKAAGQMRAEGQVSGYPDIIIDMACGAYHGARIELKTPTGTLQESQKRRLQLLHGRGYFCAAVKGFDDCKDLILEYFNLKSFQRIEPSEFDKKWLDSAK